MPAVFHRSFPRSLFYTSMSSDSWIPVCFIFFHERNLISPYWVSSIQRSCVVHRNIHYQLALLKEPHYCTLQGRDYNIDSLPVVLGLAHVCANTTHCYSYVYLTAAFSLVNLMAILQINVHSVCLLLSSEDCYIFPQRSHTMYQLRSYPFHLMPRRKFMLVNLVFIKKYFSRPGYLQAISNICKIFGRILAT